jgi:hypothetical protein
MRAARLAAVLVLMATLAGALERLADPIEAFVAGYDPSGNDFLANVPERTVLLRIRADLDGDGRPDLAVSDSSTWGNAGGQWLLFRGQPDGLYLYWGTLFFAPGVAVSRPAARELTVYVRTGASRGSLTTYRLDAGAIAAVAQSTLDLERAPDRVRYEATFNPGGGLPVEYCKLLDYRHDPGGCWRPGLGLR